MDPNDYSNHSYHSCTSQPLDLIPSSQRQKSAVQPPQRKLEKVVKTTKGKIVLLAEASQVSYFGESFLEHFEPFREGGSSGGEKHEYHVLEELDGIIRWNFCDSNGAIRDMKLCEPFELVLLDSDEFLNAVVSSTDDTDFPALRNVVAGRFQCIGDDCNRSKANKIVALVDLDKACLRFQKKVRTDRTGLGGGSPKNVADLVDSAASFLLYELCVEVVRVKRPAELCEYLATLTRLVAGRVADDQLVVTEIDCVAKAFKEKPPADLSERETDQFELQQTWSAMLQMVPLMSKDKAQALLKNADVSCPRKLRRLFHHHPDPAVAALPPEKRMLLLQNQFGRGKTGKTMNQAKLSKHLYHVVTSVDPNASVHDV